MPILSLSQFACAREGYALFQPVDFQLTEGGLVQIAGPNGAGKTTLLRALAGLFSDWTGEYRYRGEVVREPPASRRSELLYLGHHPAVKPTLTALENLQWYCGLHGWNTAQARAALGEVGLAAYVDTPCQYLSAGQQRRVALARLYVTDATVWILDEPFTAIDRQGVARLETLLSAHVSKGGAVLLTTHQPPALPDLQVLELRLPQGGEQ